MSKFNIFTIDLHVILSIIVATGVYALLLKFLQKNSPHNVQTKGGGVKGLLNNVKKTALFLHGGFLKRLTEDLRGVDARNLPLDIGCRGVINQRNAANLEYLCNLIGIRGIKRLKGDLGRIAVIGSYRIWLARNSQEWSSGELFKVS